MIPTQREDGGGADIDNRYALFPYDSPFSKQSFFMETIINDRFILCHFEGESAYRKLAIFIKPRSSCNFN